MTDTNKKPGIFMKEKKNKSVPSADALVDKKDVKKRWLMIAGVASVVIFVAVSFTTKEPPKPPPAAESPSLKAGIGGSIQTAPAGADEKAFTAKWGQQLEQLRQDQQVSQAAITDLKKQLADSQAAAASAAAAAVNKPVVLEPTPVGGVTVPPAPPCPPGNPNCNSSTPTGGVIKPGNGGTSTLPSGSNGGTGPITLSPPVVAPLVHKGPKEYPIDGAGSSDSSQATTPAEQGGLTGAVSNMAKEQVSNGGKAINATYSTTANKNSGFLVPGAIVNIDLINGIDAGTSQTSQAHPQPVLLRIKDNAVLPGSATYKLKNCFAIGAGYGDLSAERVYIRVSRLSCVDKKDKLVLTSEIAAEVVDSDNKLGMRGIVTDKQGAKLGKAMLAGFAQGLASALGQAQTTVTSTALGNTSSVSGGAAMRAAGLSGAQKATDMLAEIYIKEAQALFPVITIDAGRTASMFFVNGVQLVWNESDTLYTTTVNPNNK